MRGKKIFVRGNNTISYMDKRVIKKDRKEKERKRKIAVAAKLCMRNKKFKQQS